MTYMTYFLPHDMVPLSEFSRLHEAEDDASGSDQCLKHRVQSPIFSKMKMLIYYRLQELQ